ncbi:Uncharacterized protein PBTT_04331 [Plasmodiophora brassicae]|uniref:Uncharacterized protein n=1 Tax=Plasmodiophora brassicae TaxID=37360 RepID=A0A0G4IGH4_PLABS|nr:hypothetical protein PBRA_000091 [Plasmodiophora brassicae]SPQ96659.1 unnamed protein product [Plasmodiophora brassicae]
MTVVDVILAGCWRFYLSYGNGRQLAYMVPGGGLAAQYDNEGAWVRSYADVTAFWRLAQRYGRTEEARPYMEHALERYPSASLQSRATRLSMIMAYRGMDAPDAVALRQHLRPVAPGIYDACDLSFSNPQIVLALVQGGDRQAAREFVASARRWIAHPLRRHGVFAANWVGRALTACQELVPELREPVANLTRAYVLPVLMSSRRASLTADACALTGLLAVADVIAEDRDRIRQYVADRFALIARHQRDDGGFPYHYDGTYVRTDVTTHVVEVALGLARLASESARPPEPVNG